MELIQKFPQEDLQSCENRRVLSYVSFHHVSFRLKDIISRKQFVTFSMYDRYPKKIDPKHFVKHDKFCNIN